MITFIVNVVTLIFCMLAEQKSKKMWSKFANVTPVLIFPGISDLKDYEDQYDDGDLDYLNFESNVSETEAETNEIAAGHNKRKSITDLNTDADDQSGKKPSKTKKEMTFQEEVLEVQKQQLNLFQELEKRHMEFMEKMLTEQKKVLKRKKKQIDFFLQLGKIFCEK